MCTAWVFSYCLNDSGANWCPGGLLCRVGAQAAFPARNACAKLWVLSPCEHYFLMWEQVEGLKFPFEMFSQASFCHVGASWGLQVSTFSVLASTKLRGTWETTVWEVFETYRFLIHKTMKSKLVWPASDSCFFKPMVTSFSACENLSANPLS